jgi:hypothetical protein
MSHGSVTIGALIAVAMHHLQVSNQAKQHDSGKDRFLPSRKCVEHMTDFLARFSVNSLVKAKARFQGMRDPFQE